MRRCKCGSCAINDDPAGVLCDRCWRDVKIEKLRAACLDASTRINEIMDRRDGELRGAAWGDLDNLRLDLGLAAKAAGGDDAPA